MIDSMLYYAIDAFLRSLISVLLIVSIAFLAKWSYRNNVAGSRTTRLHA